MVTKGGSSVSKSQISQIIYESFFHDLCGNLKIDSIQHLWKRHQLIAPISYKTWLTGPNVF